MHFKGSVSEYSGLIFAIVGRAQNLEAEGRRDRTNRLQDSLEQCRRAPFHQIAAKLLAMCINALAFLARKN